MRYARFPQMSDNENMRPIGTMALRYTLPVIGTFFLESSMVVKRAMSWVMSVAKPRCHVVRMIAVDTSVERDEERQREKRTEFCKNG